LQKTQVSHHHELEVVPKYIVRTILILQVGFVSLI